MAKLEIEKKQSTHTPPENIYFYYFTMDNGDKKAIKFTEESHKAIEGYFKPKTKRKDKEPAPAPKIEDVRAYFKLKGYSEEAANKFYDYYTETSWRGANNAPILNWKGKALAVWFVDKNKIKEQSKSDFFR